ncbi:MAG TPA: ATP-binding protein, partial [Kofleriaceae bacterium]
EGVVVLDHGAWHRFGAAAGLRSSDIRYLVARADGRICTAYHDGLGVTCFRYAAGRISALQHLDEDAGLASNVVYFLGEDRWRRLWIGTGDGVDVDRAAPGDRPRLEHFDERDGLAGNDSSARAFLADADGSIWMGASGGASHLAAQRYAGPPPPPRVLVLGGRLGDVALPAAGLETSHDRNALRLELAASSLVDPERVELQTRLSPLETEWTSTHHQRQVQYPSLLPDSYQLEVRARIDTGAWGPTTTLAFEVRAAWWQRPWFPAALAGLGLCVIAAGFTWRQRRVLGQRTRQLHAQSEAAFRAVIDQMPELISVHRDDHSVYLNRAGRHFLELADDAAPMPRAGLLGHLHPEDRPVVMALFATVRTMPPQHPSEVIEMRFRGADGSWRSCEVWGLLIVLAGRRTVIAAARDVTERKRMRAKLLVTDRMASLGTLAAGIAHEINNPLAYVTGNLEAMAETLAATERPTAGQRRELRAAIEDARDGAERVRRIVLGLRSFSRSEDEQRKPLALDGVLEAAIRMTSNELRHRAVLVRELGPAPMVVADDGRLTQVFINLLVNAAHAIPEGHTADNRITVRTRTDANQRAVIEIEDTGCGIAPEVQARVFDPFFTTKDVGEGTGLGLSICHGIISGLGGQISLESAASGTGTVVRIVLPPAPELPVVVAVAPEPSAPIVAARRPRVLLVDDELMVAQTMERLLRRDYDLTIALCGQDALDHIARGTRFDAIVSDVMMPNMTGLELYDHLQTVDPGQARRLIFLSGGAFTLQTRDRLDHIGAAQLEKPVTAKQLRASLQQTIADAGLTPMG